MTRCDVTGRDDERLLGRRPGNGMRSAMLLSGLTTWLSVTTASCSASIVGVSASSPGASRLSVSATSASLQQRPVLRGQRVEQSALGQQAIGHPVLAQHPLDQTVVGEQLIGQPARGDDPRQRTVVGGHPVHQPAFGCHLVDQPTRSQRPRDRAVLGGQPVQQSALGGQLIDQPAGLQQPVDRDRSVPTPGPSGCVVVHQPGQPVRALDGVVDAQHVRDDPDPDLAAEFASPNVRCAMPSAPLAIASPASATASPTRTGAVARSVRALPRSIGSVYGPRKAKLTGSPQRSCRIIPSEVVDISGMAMAALPENMPEARVLVVDDETNIVELLSVSLKFQGFEVYTASNGPAALDKAREVRPDAVILDVMMPGMDGFGLLRRLRADGIDAPALFLTARDTLQDKIAGLTLGGDDYVTKPFSLEEVVARLRVILRRTGRGVEEPRNARLTFADIELDEDTHEVWKAGQPVSLSPTEFTLLRYFIINAGTVLSKPKILDHVWRYDFGGDVNVVESYVSYLRRKIDTGEKRLLHTLRGVGYVLREPR